LPKRSCTTAQTLSQLLGGENDCILTAVEKAGGQQQDPVIEHVYSSWVFKGLLYMLTVSVSALIIGMSVSSTMDEDGYMWTAMAVSGTLSAVPFCQVFIMYSRKLT
jgi:hypothetical protein